MFDTNILISAIFSNQGTPYKAIAEAVRLEFEICVCSTIRNEVHEKFKQKWPVYYTASEVFMESSYFVDVEEPSVLVPEESSLRDPKDRPIYRAAASSVDYLVTGDKDLLEFSDARIPIVTAADFVSITRDSLT
jgi:putative PIN family toxin of toxin-antitoxin system